MVKFWLGVRLLVQHQVVWSCCNCSLSRHVTSRHVHHGMAGLDMSWFVVSTGHWANIGPRDKLSDQIWSVPCALSYISKNEQNINWIQMVRRILTKVLFLFWCFAHRMNYCPLNFRFIFWSHVNFEMFDEIFLLFVSLAALVALEWSLPSVLPHVFLQISRISASIVALVTFERFFTGMRSHHVFLQMNSLNAGELAQGASLWLFTRVSPLVRLQVAWSWCFKFALIAVVKIVPSVPLDMRFEIGRRGAWKCALWALVWFLPCVDEGVSL